MSMSINSAMNQHVLHRVDRGARDVSTPREKVDSTTQPIGKQAEHLQNRQNRLAEAPVEHGQQHLEIMAERLAARTEAVAQRFDEMNARLSEHFTSLEVKALENGNDDRAALLAEMGEKVTNRLDDVSERIVAQLDKMSERINTILSESYGDIGETLSVPEEAAIDEVA